MISFEELARSTEEMNGAQLKAVCVEAGMVSDSPLLDGVVLIISWLCVKMPLSSRTSISTGKLNDASRKLKLILSGILEVQARKAKEHHVSSLDLRHV
jgi:SpoVK/Ycf46/Vps4 family AAA+-type ATPase